MDKLQLQLDTPQQLEFERAFYIGSYVTAILFGEFFSESFRAASCFDEAHFIFFRHTTLHVLFIELLPPLLFHRDPQRVLFLHIL